MTGKTLHDAPLDNGSHEDDDEDGPVTTPAQLDEYRERQRDFWSGECQRLSRNLPPNPRSGS